MSTQLPNRMSLIGLRLRKHADYQRAYLVARKHSSSSMSWFLAPQPRDENGQITPATPRVGLTVGKVIGPAHERNRIKRRLREVLRKNVVLLPRGFDLILHPRRIVLAMEYSKLQSEVMRILAFANQEVAKAAAGEPLGGQPANQHRPTRKAASPKNKPASQEKKP